MQENIYDRIHSTLSWKRILGFNVVLFLILIVPLSVKLAQQSTENRSGAAAELTAPVVTPPPNYPSNSPVISRVSEFYGKPGDTVVLVGSNFGDYQWGSHVYVGAVEAMKDSIVRWSNTVLEVKIPDSARTGRVSLVVNGHEAVWDGSLLLYDVARSGQVGLAKVAGGQVRLYATNSSNMVHGMVEIGYLSEPVTVVSGANIAITDQSTSADSLGKKIKVQFNVTSPIPSSQTTLMTISYPGIGPIEILRAEFFDKSQGLMSVYSDPLSVKVLP